MYNFSEKFKNLDKNGQFFEEQIGQIWQIFRKIKKFGQILTNIEKVGQLGQFIQVGLL